MDRKTGQAILDQVTRMHSEMSAMGGRVDKLAGVESVQKMHSGLPHDEDGVIASEWW